jgi:hypothetical protein
MKTVKLPVAALLVVAFAACGEGEPDRPITTESWPDPVMTSTTQQVPLQDMAGAGMSGDLIVTPFGDSVVFHVNLNDGAPEETYPVRVMEGTCQAQGREFAVLEAVFTGRLGNGRSQRALTEDPQRVLAGQHHVAVYAPTARIGRDRPVACAAIPAMQNVAGQSLPEQQQPGQAAPGQVTPGTTPGDTVPGGTAPAQPGQTAPGQTAPGQTAPPQQPAGQQPRGQ